VLSLPTECFPFFYECKAGENPIDFCDNKRKNIFLKVILNVEIQQILLYFISTVICRSNGVGGKQIFTRLRSNLKTDKFSEFLRIFWSLNISPFKTVGAQTRRNWKILAASCFLDHIERDVWINKGYTAMRESWEQFQGLSSEKSFFAVENLNFTFEWAGKLVTEGRVLGDGRKVLAV
jgi:hypothetical protein